jgi:hypothetical protein
MKAHFHFFGWVLVSLLLTSSVIVTALSVFVYQGPAHRKQASGIARKFFHFLYQASQDADPVQKQAATPKAIK